MNEFKITSGRKQQLAKSFDAKSKTINILDKTFNVLNIRGQYLAHHGKQK
jgi:hypothetical protein